MVTNHALARSAAPLGALAAAAPVLPILVDYDERRVRRVVHDGPGLTGWWCIVLAEVVGDATYLAREAGLEFIGVQATARLVEEAGRGAEPHLGLISAEDMDQKG